MLLALTALTTGPALATGGLALAATGSQPGNLILSPASGAASAQPTWSTTDGCPSGYQGSAEMSEFNTNGTLASRISPVVNGGLTTAFRGTLDGKVGALLRVTDVKKGGTVEFAIGCYSLIGGTGSVKWVQSTAITLSSAGTAYTTSSSGSGQGTSAGASGLGTPVEAALIAGACGLGIGVVGVTWYRRRNRSQLT